MHNPALRPTPRRTATLVRSFVLAGLAAAAARSAGAQIVPSLDTLAVVASRTGIGNVGRSVETITREQIARSSARTIADVLARAANVDLDKRSAAQGDVSIRGSSPEQTVVLVDGVRMSDVQSAHYALDLAVPLASVERIEILRGAGSALYGPDAVGGVINIVTRRDTPSQLAVRGGSFGTIGGSAITGAKLGSSSLTTSADYEKSDGHRDGTDYRDGQARASLLLPTASGMLRSNLAIGVRDFGASDFYAPYNSIERTTTTTLDSRWEQALGGWSLTAGGSTRRHLDDYVLVRGNPSIYENRHESWQTGGELVARTAAGPLNLALGAEGVHDQLSSARLGGRRESRLGAYVEGTAGSPSSATVDVGLRGDRSSTYGSYFSPSLSGAARLADWLHVRTSGAVGFRAPTWTERYYVDPSNQGNANLSSERFWTADAGARASAGGLSLDVAGFVRHATNLIDWVHAIGAPAPVLWRTMNIGDATFRGVEAALGFPTAGGIEYSLIGNGLSVDASQGASYVGKYALRPIVRQFGARAALLERGGFSGQLDLVDARRANESSYFTGNARLAWAHRSYRVTVDLLNAANATWLDASGKNSAGRGVYVGLERTLP